MRNIQFRQYFINTGILFLLLLNTGLVKAQKTSGIYKGLLYRLTVGGGFGWHYSLQEDGFGVGANIEFAFQKNNRLYGLGIRAIEEFQLFSYSNVPNSVTSTDITYGRSLQRGAFFSSISAGIGWVTCVQKGALLSTQGGWFFSYSTYEKISSYTIGLPISAKIFWVPARFYGLGTELYVNINTKNTFYGINFCHQFGKLRPAIKKK